MNPLALAFALALAAAAGAQNASFTTHGTPCVGTSRAGSASVRLDGSLPIFGSTYTVTVRGPAFAVGTLLIANGADLVGVDMSGIGMTGCRQYVTGALVSVPLVFDALGIARTPMNATPAGSRVCFQARVAAIGVNPAGMLLSNLGIAVVGAEPPLTAQEIAQFAPVVRIHPAEQYRPMSPDEFLARSRFRHHRGWQSDQGFHRLDQRWVTTDSHDPVYYGIPAAVLNAYGLHADGRNRRPRDGNSGDSYNVFLQPDGRLTGPTAPTGVVPAYYHYRRIGERHDIQYWWFCGFNDSLGTFNHQGDWEHVTVHVVNRRIVGVYFAAHEGGTVVQDGAGLRYLGGRPLVYMAKGSHASYRTTGSWMAGIDSTSDSGPQWDTSRLLRPLAAQPWKDYAGAWGEVGTIATTTGPLGPWHKRHGP